MKTILILSLILDVLFFAVIFIQRRRIKYLEGYAEYAFKLGNKNADAATANFKAYKSANAWAWIFWTLTFIYTVRESWALWRSRKSQP